jgi:small multidrug resistance family-3 protein
VNLAPADFGRLLGIYVVLFFVVAQVVNLIAFGVRPDTPILVGGALITAGGAVITLWRA